MSASYVCAFIYFYIMSAIHLRLGQCFNLAFVYNEKQEINGKKWSWAFAQHIFILHHLKTRYWQSCAEWILTNNVLLNNPVEDTAG